MSPRTLGLLVPLGLSAVMAGGTVLVGWGAVPALAALFGAFAGRRVRRVGGTAALAALLAWGGLLVVDALGPRFGAVAAGLAGVMRLPAAALVAVTLLFAALLAWSAATLAAAVGRVAMR